MVLRFQTMGAVEAGDELFIDYSLTADDGSPPSKYPCHCGSPNCRGTMLAPVEAVAEKDGPATAADVAPAASDPRRQLSDLPW